MREEGIHTELFWEILEEAHFEHKEENGRKVLR
jgi:hypothetical protein